jgi:TonB-linked SusC/RagA family outer membrane protein
MRRKLRLIGLIFFTCVSQWLVAQTKTVTGKLTDPTGNPVANATIGAKLSRAATTSATDGSFTLAVTSNDVLTISCVGFETQEVTVNGSSLNIQLKQSSSSLSEVVVTALGVKREKRQLTYSTQEVKGDVVLATKEPSVLNALTGRVSGVQITSSTGAPGSSSRIVIRGQSTLTGAAEALIVMDGVPINNSETGNAGNGAGMSRLSDIDPAIIENITVLKGSAASALYGAQGARGVVLITTRNGAANRKPVIGFSSQVSMETAILPEVQDKYSLGDNGIYADGETQKTSTVWGARIDTLKPGGVPVYYKNPMKDFFQTGLTYTNTINLSGGSGKSNYFLSYSYLNQKGTVPRTLLKRHTMFAKYTSAVSDQFTTTFQLGYTNSLNDRIPEGYELVSPLWTVYTAPYTWNPKPVYDANGAQRIFRASRNNPYWCLDNVHDQSVVNRFLPVVTLAYTPAKWLTITERLGADLYTEQTKYYEAPSALLATNGTITDRSSNFRQFNHDLIIEGRKQFGNDWNVSLLIGNNVFSTYSQTHSITGVGLTITDFQNVSNASTITASENHRMQRKVGFYAQSNIEFKKLVNLSLTGRYDGSSVLSRDESFYPYGSASLAFLFSELIRVPAIDFGKIRLSYSSVGNDNVGPYLLTTPFGPATSFPYNGVAGFLQSTTAGNSLLKNEMTNELEVGLEMRFLKNRLGFELSYFDRKHIDLLTSVALPASTGSTSTTLNVGDMTNKGIEALFNITPIKTNKFSWDMTISYTKINNKVVRISGDQPSLSLGQTFAFLNEPFGVFYNIGYQRNAAGQVLIDNSGLPLGTTTNIKIGNVQPDWLGGISNTFRYGNMSLSFFFDIRKGGDILNSDERYGFFYGTPKVTENRQDLVVPGVNQSDGKENTKVVSARNYYQRLNLNYESVIQDGSYIKLRNVNFAYTLPANTLKRTPFATMSVVLTGRNLWIHAPNFTGADPEVSSYGSSAGSQGVYAYSVPTSRSFNLTLNLTLK